MRNLKKILALVLALVMSLSLMATAGAADFSDKDQISDKYSDAVTVLNGLEVFKGYDNGARFEPQGDITRAEVAAIIYRIATGDVSDTQKDIYSTWGLFTDVADGSWYAGYVNYCANAGYIKGRGNKIFDPNGKVTGYEALAMILRAIGYDKNNEFSGSNWQVNTASIAKQRGITNNITDTLLGQAATREVVAEILFQAILVPTVTFNTATISYTNNATSLGKDVLNLDKVTGVVVANEYANVQDDDLKVLAEGKTQLRVAAGDVRTLDLGTDLNDVGMSENAYIQGSKVLLISEADNTVFDNTDKNGEHVDISSASKFSDVSGLSKNDDTEFFVNFDHVTRHEANRRIELRVTFRSADAEAAFNNYSTVNISKVAVDNGYSVYVNGSASALPLNGALDYEVATGYGYPVEYVKVFRVEDEVKDNDLSVIRGIFGMADDEDATTWNVTGSIYVGTSSRDYDIRWYYGTNDKSDTMSYKAFRDEYINDVVDKKWDTSDDGEWVKIIDNNGDGIADYAFRTDFTLDKAVSTYTNNDKSTLRYYGLDIIKSDYTARYMNTVAEGDIVLWTAIDDQALIWKAETAEDEITKINDIYSRNVTATTKGGTTYSQSEIDNASRLDQRIDQMDETVNYRMYLDAFGRIRAYEPVDGTKYALITEMYYGNLRNGRYVVDDVLTAELKAGDAAITERVVNNPLNNDFILNFSDNALGVRDTWSQLNTWMMDKRDGSHGVTQDGAYSYYITDLYKNWAKQGVNINRPLGSGVDWADYVVLQPAVAGLGYANAADRTALSIFDNATTNVARYVVNADGTVNLSTAVQRNYKADGTLADVNKNGWFAVDYVELTDTSVSSKQNVYTAANNRGDGFSRRVDANMDTEYYIVSNSGVEHFVGYSNLPAISGIRSMYAVARNTSTDYVRENYWVAEVVVIEADNYAAQPDDYVFVIGRADMVGNNVQANRQAVGSQYLYAISAKNGAVRIAPTNLSWGVGTVLPGFYKAYGVSQMENGIIAVDRLSKVEPAEVNDSRSTSCNTANFKLRAGTVNRTAGLNDNFGVTMAGSGEQRQITLKGPSFAIIQDGRGYINLSTRLDGDNWTNQVVKEHKILWVEDGSSNALFTIDVTQSNTSAYKNGIVALLNTIYGEVAISQGNPIGGDYTVTVKAVDSKNEAVDKAVVYLQKSNGNFWNVKGNSFRISKNETVLFKPVAGYKFDIVANATPNCGDNGKIVKRGNLGDEWYELTDVTGDVTINVQVQAKNDDSRKVIVQTNDSSVTVTESTSVGFNDNKILENTTITLKANAPGKSMKINSLMIGATVLTKGVDYDYTTTANGDVVITFLKDIDKEGHVVIDLTIAAITEVTTVIEVPMVPEKETTPTRNSRLADKKVPLFFVNNMRTWTTNADNTKAIFDLGTTRVGTEKTISFQFNPQANATGYGAAVVITLPGSNASVVLELRAGATATITYKVKDTVETEVAEIKPITDTEVDLVPDVKINNKTVNNTNGSVEVYKISNDTQSVSVSVSGVIGSASISVYAVDNDTSAARLTGTGSVKGNLVVPVGDGTAKIQVTVTYLERTEKYTYTVNFVERSSGTQTTPPTEEDGETTDPARYMW